MKKKYIYSIIIVIVLLAAGYKIYSLLNDNNSVAYNFVEVTRGDIENTISSTGSIGPVTTVEIGTQVSGIIDRVFVDFNDIVKKDQLLAVLDTILLKASVLDAEAGVARAEAQYEQAIADYDRNLKLFEKELIPEADYLPYQINVKMQKAALISANVALDRAKQNIKYAVIRSPIDGIVIARNVEAGQTVAASLSTPTLFEIANNLSQMEILVDVDESDIGLIRDNMAVRFDVQAYSDKIFGGTVRQIRLKPTVESNVVNYTVVVDVTNNENLLLPGMTATVDFVLEQKIDVLLVPLAALRFSPSDDVVASIREKRQSHHQQQQPGDSPDESGSRTSQPPGISGKSGRAGANKNMDSQNRGMLWFLDENGQLAMEPVQIGISDGAKTEIIRSRSITEGTKIISGLNDREQSNTSSGNNALSPGSPRHRPRF